MHLLLHAPLISGLGPAPLVVLPVHLVLDGWELDQPVRRTAQHPSGLAVHEQQRPAPAHAELGERLDQRRVVDHRTGSDRARQLDRLEQPDRAAREEGERVRAFDGEGGALEVVARFRDVAAQGLLLVARQAVRLTPLAVGLVE